jgi:flagellar motor switch protein FliG
MSKVVILAINAKYVHSSLSVWYLAKGVSRYARLRHDVKIVEATINQPNIDIARRVALMDRTSPEILKEVEGVLRDKVSSIFQQDFTQAGGIDAVVGILNSADRGTEKLILEELEKEDAELADEIRKRMFIFEDMITLDDASIQRVVREIDTKDLAKALKGASEEVKERIFRNISKRAAEMLQDDLDFLGPVRLREVEDAQQRIVGVIRRLDEAGEIIISRGGEDAIIV